MESGEETSTRVRIGINSGNHGEIRVEVQMPDSRQGNEGLAYLSAMAKADIRRAIGDLRAALDQPESGGYWPAAKTVTSWWHSDKEQKDRWPQRRERILKDDKAVYRDLTKAVAWVESGSLSGLINMAREGDTVARDALITIVDALDSIMAELHNRLASDLFESFGDRLRSMSGDKLDPLPRRFVGPTDVANAAVMSFIKPRVVIPRDFRSLKDTWPLLRKIAWRKCLRLNNKYRRESAVIENFNVSREDGISPLDEVADRRPGPRFEVEFSELVNAVCSQIKAKHREIARLYLMDYDIPMIMEQGYSKRTVQRVIAQVKTILMSEFGIEPED